MTAFITAVLSIVVGTTVQILVLINGWGLEPRNWNWIIGGAIANLVLLMMIGALKK